MPTLTDELSLSLRQHEEPFLATFALVGFGAGHLSLDGQWTMVSQRLCEIVGYSRDELLTRSFQDIQRPQESQLDLAQTGLVSGQVQVFSFETRIRRRDGDLAWLKVVMAPVRDEETRKPHYLFAVIEDISACKRASLEAQRTRLELTGRLMAAQEAERARIALELHDDIGQSLALLGIQMQRAALSSPATPAGGPSDLRQLASKVKEISLKVSRISHQLHSSELEYLGLAVAVRGLCREFTEQAHIPVECHCDGIPAGLNPDIALCFLRVVQEALHNVAKHSRANKVQVAIVGSKTGLRLTVSDDGAGFDANRPPHAPGLGLISMSERMHLVGGECEVTSRPGGGTEIRASLPLASADARAATD